jgi:hypothetical protein
MATSNGLVLGGVPDDMMSEEFASEFFAIDDIDHDDDELEDQDLPSQTESPLAINPPPPLPTPSLPASSTTKHKEKGAKSSYRGGTKLNLLGLPIDILRLIVQEVGVALTLFLRACLLTRAPRR